MTGQRARPVFVFCFAMLSLAACGEVPEDPLADSHIEADPSDVKPELASAQQAIINATNIEAQAEALRFVRLVGMRPDGFRPFCGGALISNQWVVTAKHCLEKSGLQPSQILFSLGNSSQWGSAALLHPNRDYAVVVLQNPMPNVPAGWSRSTMAIDPDVYKGRTVVCAGIGSSGSVGPWTAGFWPIEVKDPGTKDLFRVNEVYNGGGRSCVEGDSGGPCLLLGVTADANQSPLVGVNSYCYGGPWGVTTFSN